MSSKRAVCIGINDYPGTNLDLFGCVNDANDWSEVLTQRGFACEILLDSAATGSAIRKKLTHLANISEPGDIVVIVYAGHGSVVSDQDGDESDGLDECWCPYDVTTQGVITDDELNEVYGQRKSGVRWILISDSCNSGTVSRRSALDDMPLGRAAKTQVVRSRFLPPNLCASKTAAVQSDQAIRRFRASAPGRRGAMLLAACREDQESMDAWFDGRPNGAFTYSALKALSELEPDADYETWFNQIRRYLPSQRFPQEPSLFDVANRRKKWLLLAAEDEGPSDTPPRQVISRTLDADAMMIGQGLAAQSLSQFTSRRMRSRSAPKFLIAEGDSWFHIPIYTDLIDELENRHGFDVTSVAHYGHTLESMAFALGQRDGFTRQFVKMVERDQEPAAVLLSGGGNDFAGEQFRLLINPAPGQSRGANDVMINELIHVRLRQAYITLIGAIDFIAERKIGHKIPILLHGYAYAVPDGRGFGWIQIAGPWLQPAFTSQGYDDLEERREITDKIIDAFNAMLENLAGSPELSHVHYNRLLDLFPREDDHRKWWNDELHPTKRGFRLLANTLAEKINAVT